MFLVTGLPILCLVPILPLSLICPSYVLSQCYLCLWFINSCFNAACASDYSIMCPIPIPHVSLVCSFCVLSQFC
jgi:hypothetical protein